jgi:hypothetical protein
MKIFRKTDRVKKIFQKRNFTSAKQGAHNQTEAGKIIEVGEEV